MTIHLEKNQVPAALRGAYSGNHFKAEVVEVVTIPADAGLWDGGSRDLYKFVVLETGEEVDMPGQKAPPWGFRAEYGVSLEPGFAVVRHTYFCGQDLGLTFYVHPENAAALLPAPVELTPTERFVLEATRGLKSSYMGKDRYTLATEYSREPITRQEWDEAKASLIERKLLNKAGAITTAGRNAIEGAR